MPEVTFRIEDSSPLLSYSQGWSAGNSNGDDLLSLYTEASMMQTSIADASVLFTFYGTEVEVFGGTRPNHGRYQAGVDGALAGYQKQPSTVDSWQQSLFKESNLPLGQHTVRLVNAEQGKYLDVDYVTWKGETGKYGGPTKMLTVQPDEEEYFKFSKSGNWTNPVQFPVDTYFGGSGRVSDAKSPIDGCPKPLNHAGDTVALYGPVGPYGTRYGVCLNGGAMAEYTSQRQFYKSQQMLFSANGLTGSRQTLEVVFLGNSGNPGGELSIDFANIYVRPKTAVTPSMVFGLAFSTAVAFMASVTLALIGLQFCFGWFPFLGFVVPHRQRSTASRVSRAPHSDDPLPYPKELLPQFSPSPLRKSGPPSAITFTEISDYPFSSSDYYVRTTSSEARTKSSKMTLSTSKTPRSRGKVAQTPKSGNSRSNNSHRPYMSAIHEGSNLARDGGRDSTPSSAIANSWMLRNVEGEASTGSLGSERREDSAG